ncbi:hypothetical protein QVD17_10368 [Tagetes erecta]|uniref:Cyclin D3 n=1 Tax=Tagetes erecta TaxID=13708 RepID=A0AAD8P4Q7_TARER|nr:hypothetical protein QVD17_10368 [Tagetes erecta]
MPPSIVMHAFHVPSNSAPSPEQAQTSGHCSLLSSLLFSFPPLQHHLHLHLYLHLHHVLVQTLAKSLISFKMMTLLDSLYCEEKHQWDDDDDDDDEQQQPVNTYTCLHNDNNNNSNNFQQDLFWEHQDLSSLITKEFDQRSLNNNNLMISATQRHDAVDWILTVVSHYSFSPLTAVLAVNYLDRFLETFQDLEIEKKPWIIQLASVSCLSLAAKVEETHVPLLLDLQLDGSKYIFEPKTIQKMEILILSTLQWRMNPVTPLSYLDYITTKLGLKTHLSSEFIKRCECLILCLLPDGRFMCYLPSVIATATMVHVINSIEPCIGIEYQSQLLGILGVNKENVKECWKDIQEITCSKNSGRHFKKRKFGSVPGSPDAVMDLCFSSDESSPVVNVNMKPSVSTLLPETGNKKSKRVGM